VKPNNELAAKIAEAMWMGHEPRPMVQVVCLTIDGQKVVCLGPVLHVPPAGLHVGEIQEIEFGELIPAHLAARLLDGDFTQDMGVQ
jgi:hypothetical protein